MLIFLNGSLVLGYVKEATCHQECQRRGCYHGKDTSRHRAAHPVSKAPEYRGEALGHMKAAPTVRAQLQRGARTALPRSRQFPASPCPGAWAQTARIQVRSGSSCSVRPPRISASLAAPRCWHGPACRPACPACPGSRAQ